MLILLVLELLLSIAVAVVFDEEVLVVLVHMVGDNGVTVGASCLHISNKL